MAKIKNILKAIVPPILVSIVKSKRAADASSPNEIIWQGDYESWEVAKSNCIGYESEIILEKCRTSLLKVKNGEVAYERDSVTFSEIQYSWGLLAGLQRAAIENNGRLCVLDFGGSLGSTYFQNRTFLKNLKGLTWCIIEQPHFVNCGKLEFEDESLKFYNNIEDCLKDYSPNVLLLSSVLQYLDDPYYWVKKFTALNIDYIILDRTAFTESDKNIITIQTVSGQTIYPASYPMWFFSQKELIHLFSSYISFGPFPSFCDNDTQINGDLNAFWAGFIFKK